MSRLRVLKNEFYLLRNELKIILNCIDFTDVCSVFLSSNDVILKSNDSIQQKILMIFLKIASRNITQMELFSIILKFLILMGKSHY